ncbi:MAG: crossover junction endodeoxyribonuclease RuvC [Bacteroidales bacterium]
METEEGKIILGIDPGTIILGYGLIRQTGKQFSFLDMGVLNLSKIKDPTGKLKAIFDGIIKIIDQYHPDEFAIEAPFYGKNVQSLIKLGRAQGVAIAAALSREIPASEYAPLRVKQSITGHGNASKEQVCAMLFHLMKIDAIPKFWDASDALAIAVCHALQGNKIEIADQKANKSPSRTRGNSWESFIANHKDRIR